METQNYYNILEISSTASEEEIRSAYRALSKKYHPDIAGNSDETQKHMAEINEAYRVLSNSNLRKQYDAKLQKDQMGQDCHEKDTFYQEVHKPTRNVAGSKAGNSLKVILLLFAILLFFVLRGCIKDSSPGKLKRITSDELSAIIKYDNYATDKIGPLESSPDPFNTIPTEITKQYPNTEKWDNTIEKLLKEGKRALVYETRLEKCAIAMYLKGIESLFSHFFYLNYTSDGPELDSSVEQIKNDLMPTVQLIADYFNEDVAFQICDYVIDRCLSFYQTIDDDLEEFFGENSELKNNITDAWEAFLCKYSGEIYSELDLND